MIGYQRRVNNDRPGGLVGACDEDVELLATTVCRLIASRPPAYFATEALVAAPVHEDHMRLFINTTHFCTWVVLHRVHMIDGMFSADQSHRAVH